MILKTYYCSSILFSLAVKYALSLFPEMELILLLIHTFLACLSVYTDYRLPHLSLSLHGLMCRLRHEQ